MTLLIPDGTFISPPIFETTAQADETIAIDLTPKLVSAGTATTPLAKLYEVVDGGADVDVTASVLVDLPTIALNVLSQRFRGLTAGVDYRYRCTFLTSGNRRPISLFVRCRE
jgi:hypothetical protein